jgi:hypothetical protein
MDIQKHVDELISSGDKYIGLRNMSKFKRKYGTRNPIVDVTTVRFNLRSVVGLDIFRNFNDLEYSHCMNEKNTLFRCKNIWNTKQFSEDGCHYYYMILKCLIYLIMFEYISHNNILSNEIKIIDQNPYLAEEDKIKNVSYNKICQFKKRCQELKQEAEQDIYLDLLDCKQEVIGYFKNCEKRFDLCKRLYEVEMK